MSVIYNASQVLTDCVVHVDATNPKCYPGTGNTVYDLSGNGKNGTINGAAFSAGKFSFNGINDVIQFGTGNTVFPLPQISYEFAFRSFGVTPTTGDYPGLCGITYGIRLFVYQTYLNAGVDNGTQMLSLSTIGGGNFYNGAWNHVIVTHDSVNFRIYLNGVLNNSTTSAWSGTSRWPNDAFYIGRDNNNANYYFRGDISMFRLYKIALSADQVATNFRQISGRYGL